MAPTKPPSAAAPYNYSRRTARGDAGFFSEGFKDGLLKTMKMEGAQGAEVRTAEDGRGGKVEGRWGRVRSGKRVRREGREVKPVGVDLADWVFC